MNRPVSPFEMAPGVRLRRRIVADVQALVGRHEEPATYGGSAGDPGLVGGARSMSWEIHGDLASLLVAGSAAILMEVLHPSVMDGVFTQSSYRSEGLRRARNTLGYVLRTTFGNTRAATQLIENVKGMHARVNGVRPDGVSYRALDPELIAWVHTCIPWAVMSAFDRYKRRLTSKEKDRYLREQAIVGRMSGADWVPETVSELEDYVEQMRPKLAVNEQTVSFMRYMTRSSEEFELGRGERFQFWTALRASMMLMPRWAQRLTGTEQPELVQRLWLDPTQRLQAELIRFAYPVLPCKELALARVGA